MIRVIPYTPEMIERAHGSALRLGLLKNSITKGRGSLAGYLGQYAVAARLGVNPNEDSFNHDFLNYGKRIEVKTKRRTVAPIGTHDVSIAATSMHQSPDLYIFVSLEFERLESGHGGPRQYAGLKKVWVVGQKPPKEYLNEARLWKEGEVDPTNGFVTKSDMFNLPIDRLDPVTGDVI